MNRTYVALYLGKKATIQAADLYSAKLKAVALFKVPKSKSGMLSVILADAPVNTADI